MFPGSGIPQSTFPQVTARPRETSSSGCRRFASCRGAGGGRFGRGLLLGRPLGAPALPPVPAGYRGQGRSGGGRGPVVAPVPGARGSTGVTARRGLCRRAVPTAAGRRAQGAVAEVRGQLRAPARPGEPVAGGRLRSWRPGPRTRRTTPWGRRADGGREGHRRRRKPAAAQVRAPAREHPAPPGDRAGNRERRGSGRPGPGTRRAPAPGRSGAAAKTTGSRRAPNDGATSGAAGAARRGRPGVPGAGSWAARHTARGRPGRAAGLPAGGSGRTGSARWVLRADGPGRPGATIPAEGRSRTAPPNRVRRTPGRLYGRRTTGGEGQTGGR